MAAASMAALAATLVTPTGARACSLYCSCPEDVAPWVVPAGADVPLNAIFFVRDAAHWKLVHVASGLTVATAVTTLDDGDRSWVQPTLPLLPATDYRFEHDGDPFPVEPVELTTGAVLDITPPSVLEPVPMGPSEDYDDVCYSGDVYSSVLEMPLTDDRPLPEWIGVEVHWSPSGGDSALRTLGLLGHVVDGNRVQVTLAGTNAPVLDCPGATALTDLEAFQLQIPGLMIADGAGQRAPVPPRPVELQPNSPPSSGGCMLDPPYGAYPAGYDDDYGPGAFEDPPLPEPTPDGTGDAATAGSGADTTVDGGAPANTTTDAGQAMDTAIDGASPMPASPAMGSAGMGGEGAPGSDDPLVVGPPPALPDVNLKLDCGCRAAGRGTPGKLAWAALLSPVATLARRRRRRRA